MWPSDCKGNDPKIPLDWKHGGSFQVDNVKSNVVHEIDQGYTPGVCSFHLQEDESWSDDEGPGTERTWHYHLEQGSLKDGVGQPSEPQMAIRSAQAPAAHIIGTLSYPIALTLPLKPKVIPATMSSSLLVRRPGRVQRVMEPLILTLATGVLNIALP